MDALCRRYGSLPFAGGVLDQPAFYMLRMLSLLAIGGTLEAEEQGDPVHGGGGPAGPPDPLANIPMTAIAPDFATLR